MISPWYTGQTLPIWTIVFDLDEDDVFDASGLSGNSFAIRFTNINNSDDEYLGVGKFSILQIKPAIVQYKLDPTDARMPGMYNLLLEATYPNGELEVFTLDILKVSPR